MAYDCRGMTEGFFLQSYEGWIQGDRVYQGGGLCLVRKSRDSREGSEKSQEDLCS